MHVKTLNVKLNVSAITCMIYTILILVPEAVGMAQRELTPHTCTPRNQLQLNSIGMEV